MRRLTLAATLLLAGCATAPEQPTTPVQPVQVVPAQPRQATSVTGFTMQQLFGRFGPPALKVQEGRSLKLQFRGSTCVLDAYLYPGSTGVLRVTYIDARTLSGADTDRTRCISMLEYPS